MIGPLVLVALTAAPVGSGLWQVRTLLQGTSSARLAMVCIDGDGEWLVSVIPRELTAGCARPLHAESTPCANGGRLLVSGKVDRERLDIVVRRTGPIAAHPDAIAVLHVEGRRTASDCGRQHHSNQRIS